MSASPAPEHREEREIKLPWTLVSVIGLVLCLITVLVWLPRVDAKFGLEGHLPLVLGAAIAGGVARMHGYRWETIQEGMVQGIRLALPAILILFVVGTLIGVWIAAGVIPALISWGLAVLSPEIFLPASCLVCSLVSFVCGSSWSTAGTVGIALIGIGQAMGIDPGYTAGAVVSGAYFGDKLSPMSETTNLAPGVAGSELFTHIRHMTWTTVPAWVLAMIIYGVLGLGLEGGASIAKISAIRDLLAQDFAPGLIHLFPPALVFILVLRKMPALPSLAAGVVAALVIGLIQGTSFTELLTIAMEGFKPSTGNAAVDKLLDRGGMKSMNSTVLLIMCAMCFGGVMERTGQLRTLARSILRMAKNSASLIASTVLTSIGLNLLAADQYISIIVPGRMYKSAYDDQGLDPRNLSRALEDGGTITSALVPWNSCGAYMASTLGVATVSYAPFAFFNLINPVLGIIFAVLGVSVVKRATAAAETAA